MKTGAILTLCLALCLACWGCEPADAQPQADATAGSAQTQQAAMSAEQQRTAFQALTAASIREVDIVYTRPENGGTRVYKTFTEADDVQAVLNILQGAGLQAAEKLEPTGGWTLLVRIWPAAQANEIPEPLLISSVGRADATALAAEQRGFYLRTRESAVRRYPFEARDFAVLALGAIIAAGSFLL